MEKGMEKNRVKDTKRVLLKAERLSKTFSSGGTLQHVLKNIDLELYEGDFTVIMGASGAGKLSLIHI